MSGQSQPGIPWSKVQADVEAQGTTGVLVLVVISVVVVTGAVVVAGAVVVTGVVVVASAVVVIGVEAVKGADCVAMVTRGQFSSPKATCVSEAAF